MSYAPGPIDGMAPEVNACVPQAGALHAYVWWATQTTDAPAWWHVGTGLTLVAHEAARRGWSIGQDQTMVPRVWAAILGPSAAGKSTAIQRGLKFYRAHLEAFRNVRDPFVMAEGSIPGILEKLTEGWDQDVERTLGLLHQEEFSRLLDNRDAVAEMLMQLADGIEIERHKVSSRAAARQGMQAFDYLRAPAVSALLATTYASLRRVTRSHHLEGGLYSRLLWFVAEPDASRLLMLPSPHPEEKREALQVWREWARWFDGQEALGQRIVDVPEEVHWILRDSLFETLKERMAEDDRMNATRRRAVTQAYLVAGLLALSQFRRVVTSDDMDCAVNLVEQCVAGIEKIGPELGTSELMQAANVAFRAVVQAGGELPRSAFYKALQAPKHVVDQVLATLLDEGSLREVVQKTAGRPRTMYVSNGQARFQGSPDASLALVETPAPVQKILERK